MRQREKQSFDRRQKLTREKPFIARFIAATLPWLSLRLYPSLLGLFALCFFVTACASLPFSAKKSDASISAQLSPFSWASEAVEADGRGIAPANVTDETQRTLAARQAAKTAAIAGLKTRISRLTITGSQTVETAMSINLSVKRAIEKYLQNAEVVYEKEIEPGVWEVRMRAALAPVSEILNQHRITPEQGIPFMPLHDGHVPRET
jgi:hypothetical protein